jgi:hypothetical protein
MFWHFIFRDAMRSLSAIAAQGQAAIHQKSLAGHVIVRLKKKSHGPRYVLWTPKTAYGSARDVSIVFPGLHTGRGHPGRGGARRNNIHAHVIPSLRQNPRRMHQSSFWGGVIQARGKHRQRLHGRKKDEATVAPGSLHRFADFLRQEYGTRIIGFQ